MDFGLARHAPRNDSFILHCNKFKKIAAKGQWHFGRLLCIGAAGTGLRSGQGGSALLKKISREETCVN
jgi:hypothetical protein